MKLFAGSQSKALAESVSKLLNVPLASYELVRFADSEIKPVIKESVRGEDVVIVSSTSNPVNETYMELFLLVDALRRSACKRIIAVIPYFGYARQNQQHLPGEPVSAQVVARILETVGVDELITVDLHEEQLTGFFTIPVNHVSALPLLAEKIGEEIVAAASYAAEDKARLNRAATEINTKITVISPDQGGVERTRTFRDALETALKSHSRDGGSPQNSIDPRSGSGMTVVVDQEIGIVEKLRNLEGTHETKVVEITGDVKGKIAIIPDDVIVSGGTILHAVEAVLQKGALKVYLAATHADFLPGTAEKLQNSKAEKVFVTDTITIPDKQTFEKLHIVSVAELLSEQLKML